MDPRYGAKLDAFYNWKPFLETKLLVVQGVFFGALKGLNFLPHQLRPCFLFFFLGSKHSSSRLCAPTGQVYLSYTGVCVLHTKLTLPPTYLPHNNQCPYQHLLERRAVCSHAIIDMMHCTSQYSKDIRHCNAERT